MTTFKTFIIVCPLVFIAGFVDSIAGGGGLISLPAYLLAGLPTHNAIATNKLSSTLGTSTAFWRYAQNGYIRWKLAAFCAVFAIVGSVVGANIALQLSNYAFKIIMLCVTPICALFVLRDRHIKDKETVVEDNAGLYMRCISISLVMGTYDGFYGPGTGTFLLVFLTAVAKLKLTEANGITKTINLSSNVSALLVYLANGKTLVTLGLTAAVFSIAGNYLGARMFTSKGAKIAKPVMIAVLSGFMIKLLYEIVGNKA